MTTDADDIGEALEVARRLRNSLVWTWMALAAVVSSLWAAYSASIGSPITSAREVAEIFASTSRSWLVASWIVVAVAGVAQLGVMFQAAHLFYGRWGSVFVVVAVLFVQRHFDLATLVFSAYLVWRLSAAIRAGEAALTR